MGSPVPRSHPDGRGQTLQETLAAALHWVWLRSSRWRRGVCPHPRGHLAMSGDVFGDCTLGRGADAPGTWFLSGEAGDAAKCPPVHAVATGRLRPEGWVVLRLILWPTTMPRPPSDSHDREDFFSSSLCPQRPRSHGPRNGPGGPSPLPWGRYEALQLCHTLFTPCSQHCCSSAQGVRIHSLRVSTSDISAQLSHSHFQNWLTGQPATLFSITAEMPWSHAGGPPQPTPAS